MQTNLCVLLVISILWDVDGDILLVSLFYHPMKSTGLRVTLIVAPSSLTSRATSQVTTSLGDKLLQSACHL